MADTNGSFPAWLKVIELLLSPFRAAHYAIKRDHTDKFDTLPTVHYSALRHTIRNGDLLFCGGNFAFSKTIRYLSGKSKVSHVGIVYWWNDRLMVLEGVETDGVRIVPLSQYVQNYENSGKAYNGRMYLARDRRLTIAPPNIHVAANDVPNPAVEKLLHEAATLLNKKYSYWDALIFFWQGATGREWHTDNDAYLCSEFVAKCFLGIGLDYPDDGRGFIAPEHIAMSAHIETLVEIRKNSA